MDSDDSTFQPASSTRRSTRRQLQSVESQEEEEEEERDQQLGDAHMGSDDPDYPNPRSAKQARVAKLQSLARGRAAASRRSMGVRRSARNAPAQYGDTNGPDSDRNRADKHHQEEEEGRQLRNRKHVDYHIPPLDSFEPEADKHKADKDQRTRGKKRLPMNMSGKQLDRLFGYGQPPGPDSDEEPTPGFSRVSGTGMLGGTGILANSLLDPSNFGPGVPTNLGKMSGAANLADTDPLGIQTNIDFSHVGGMEQHIQQLKEMVSLPLLYPEVFQRFQVTPPRGVLFHGPPGTGKTLLARALAASCSSEGQKISFFMRKGADCLSKWVGEAERQLRLLFDEAKSCQPSIIFFDEIDGLAPVRSSKQEQIHASIVSTLLSLMDGMDGRGQVVIIGATNRPDAVDPALRRPGRFDREFYFPLPNREARLSILNIHTRNWNPPLAEDFKIQLADLTKGYGGADLRALCTEAALNAVQRRYPQIYKTTDRLVIDPLAIDVVPRDFTIAQKLLVPSTSRSAANIASPLPCHLQPLLGRVFEQTKALLDQVLPDIKKINILEEAEYEDDDFGFEKERMIQTFETSRIFRPRMIICGPKGSGQQHIGSAILNHLEGYHIQSLDLANLIGDSTTSADARCVQIFTEATRHKPSLLYIPSLHHWQSSTVLEGVIRTVTSLLEQVKASDPILLLAVVDCPFQELPADIRSWFGINKANRVVITSPDQQQRSDFFADTITHIQKPPTQFPDALPRRKRVLEVLPKAPPRQPRKPTESELQSQLAQDKKLIEYLKFRLGPVLNELKKKHKRFTKPIGNPQTSVPQPEGPNGEAVEIPKYYDVDLESMHYKLYYNKYFTSQQFVADVEKIVLNAEQDFQQSLTGDYELAVKAQAMLTHTRVMVEQACDQQFDIECHRMYERMKLRDPQLSISSKKKTTTIDQSKNSGLPARQSSRVSGKEPEYLYDPDFCERGIKRVMSGLEPESSSERPIKRNKAKQTSPVFISEHGEPHDNRSENRDHSVNNHGDDNNTESRHHDDLNCERQVVVHGSTNLQVESRPDIPASTTPDYEPDTPLINSAPSPVAVSTAIFQRQTSSSSLSNILNHTDQERPPRLNGLSLHQNVVSSATPTIHTLLNTSVYNDRPQSLGWFSAPNQITGGDPPDSRMTQSNQGEFSLEVQSRSVGEALPTIADSVELTSMSAEIPSREERTHNQTIVHPPFECPKRLIQELKEQLIVQTEGLKIEELEELRAGCWNSIWRFRADFDRSRMIHDCLEFVRRFCIDLESCDAPLDGMSHEN